jgi:peptidoglycan/xylan/chitin deacetylase (PgdA/CDA1 family)
MRASDWLARVDRRAVVFVFHDVTDRTRFDDCIGEISSTRHVVPLDEVASRRQPGTCALTFDDGWLSVATAVHPVLRARKLPYTVFVCTDVLMGGPVPWFVRIHHLAATVGMDPLNAEWRLGPGCGETEYELTVALKEVPFDRVVLGLSRLEAAHGTAPPAPEGLFMTSAQVGQLAAEGVSFGSHTRRHPILSRLSIEEQRHEIETSRDEVERLTGFLPSHFAYPNGSRLDFDDTTVSILRSAGFKHGYTTIQRHLSPNDEPFTLPRIGVDAGDSPVRRGLKQLAPWLSRNHATERKIRARVKA